MLIKNIIQRVNNKLAGERLQRDEMELYLDSVIDDINERLGSKFPVISEFNATSYPGRTNYDNYDLFPDQYIRSVLVSGAAFKFFNTDEEGADVAPAFKLEYESALFAMVRDYSDKVPLDFIDNDITGAITDPFYYDKLLSFSDTFML